jgi:Fe-S cluster assembly iron-binding protein IscA
MLTVTENAKKKLAEALQKQTADPEVAIRIKPSPSTSTRLELVLDKERQGDQVVESKEGKKLLLVAPDLLSGFEGIVMNYRETPQGAGFTMSKLDHGT